MSNEERIEYDENDDNTCKLEEGQKSLLLHLMGQLRIGMDLSRVTIPSYFLEPRSLLERLTDFLSHSDVVVGANDLSDPEQRFVEVVRWYLSCWHVKPKGVKKPYNPVMGEFFQCVYDLPNDGGKLTYFAEQVSHHPPVSAFYGENRKKKMRYEGHYYPRSKFLGNSAASMGEGCVKIYLDQHNETYHATWPNIYARGVIFGTLLMELGGKIKISCEETGYNAEVEFKTKGFFGGDYHVVGAKIKNKAGKTLYTLLGKWNGVVNIKDAKGKESEFFNAHTLPRLSKVVAPTESMADNESRKLWTHVTAALNEDNVDRATDFKVEIEERQRATRKEYEARGEAWKPKYFEQQGKEPGSNDYNPWRYKGNNEFIEAIHKEEDSK